jgi:GNAT superfamily N-acetyltransferase
MTLSSLWQKLFKRNTLLFYEREVGASQQHSSGMPEITVRILDEQHLNELLVIVGQELEPPLRERLQHGALCFTAVIDNSIAHVAWVYSGVLRVDEIERVERCGKGEFCVFDVQTFPAFRGGGIYPFMLGYIEQWAREHEGKRLLIYTELKNHASRRGIEKAGFNLVRKVTMVKVFGMKFYLTSRV